MATSELISSRQQAAAGRQTSSRAAGRGLGFRVLLPHACVCAESSRELLPLCAGLAWRSTSRASASRMPWGVPG